MPRNLFYDKREREVDMFRKGIKDLDQISSQSLKDQEEIHRDPNSEVQALKENKEGDKDGISRLVENSDSDIKEISKCSTNSITGKASKVDQLGMPNELALQHSEKNI